MMLPLDGMAWCVPTDGWPQLQESSISMYKYGNKQAQSCYGATMHQIIERDKITMCSYICTQVRFTLYSICSDRRQCSTFIQNAAFSLAHDMDGLPKQELANPKGSHTVP